MNILQVQSENISSILLDILTVFYPLIIIFIIAVVIIFILKKQRNRSFGKIGKGKEKYLEDAIKEKLENQSK
jgi:ACR3 family arsenite efflux pump ArsB